MPLNSDRDSFRETERERGSGLPLVNLECMIVYSTIYTKNAYIDLPDLAIYLVTDRQPILKQFKQTDSWTDRHADRTVSFIPCCMLCVCVGVGGGLLLGSYRLAT